MLSVEEKNAVIDLFPFLGNNPVVFDVGSNKGHWSDVILEEFGDNCELHLFEPNEKLLSFTEIKYEYSNNIKYNNLGVHNLESKKEFYYFENFNNEISSLFKDEWEGLPMKEKIISVVSIDSYCKSNKVDIIDFLKIDIEGADYYALQGCFHLLCSNKIGIIQIEYSEHWNRAGKELIDLFEIATAHDLTIYKYEAGNFWKVEMPKYPDKGAYDNYYLTKYEIHNYSVGGWNNEFIKNTLELENLDLVLEVGSFEGITTKYICEKLLNKNNPDARIICVDPMEDYYIEGDTEHPYFRNQYQRFLRNTRGLPVELKRGKSRDELPKLHELRFDLIYIDGDHRKDAVYFDCVWSFAICKAGGYILIDDYNWRSETREGIDKFLEEFNGFYDIVVKDYQVMIKKVTNRYNFLTEQYYL